MIVKGYADPTQAGRIVYPLGDFAAEVRHFVIREATAAHPFAPHAHAQREVWFVLDGSGWYLCDGEEMLVEAGDLILIEPWQAHGLQTDSHIRWICQG